MTPTPKQLTSGEDAIFDELEGDATFHKRLYRDGVPTPASYLAQRVRVVFVFREPNLSGKPRAVDMRDEVRDERFRPVRDGKREDRSSRAWWNAKAGMFAHAVAAALAGEPLGRSFDRFQQVLDERGWHHEIVNRYAYIQIKKVGGGGSCTPREIAEYAVNYRRELKRQLDLYSPHLIVGCGTGSASPAKLLASHVLPGGHEQRTPSSGATWWQFPTGAYPEAMVQLYHPAARRDRHALYEDVWSSVRDVARKCRLLK